MKAAALLAKLRLKPGQRMLAIQAPAVYLDDLASTDEVDVIQEGLYDVALLFARDSQELDRLAPQAAAALKPGGAFWMAYPKLSSGVKSDLTRDAGWEVAGRLGLRPVAQVSVDDTWSALRFKPDAGQTPGDLVEAQFSGPKAALRPLFDRIIRAAQGFEEDVRVEPRQSYVALARKVQFAVLRPSTATRLDLGLRLKGIAPGGRLLDAGSFGSRSVTHKISLTVIEQIDAELLGWLKVAYEGAG